MILCVVICSSATKELTFTEGRCKSVNQTSSQYRIAKVCNQANEGKEEAQKESKKDEAEKTKNK